MNSTNSFRTNQPSAASNSSAFSTRQGKKQFFGMNLGSSSLLLVFVVLCLVSFAALSIVSASADHRLTEKVSTRTQSYYEACNQAESSIAGLDSVLVSQYQSSADEDAYFSVVGHSKSYIIPITDNQFLQVEVEILYPRSDDDTFYQVTSWQVENQ